jgi:hypothetical protein
MKAINYIAGLFGYYRVPKECDDLCMAILNLSYGDTVENKGKIIKGLRTLHRWFASTR